METRNRPTQASAALVVLIAVTSGLHADSKAEEKKTAPAASVAKAQPAEVQGEKKADTRESLEVIAADPNHLSAVEALEKIRREENESAEGKIFSYDAGDRRDPFLSPIDVLKAQMSSQVCDGEGMECWLIQDVSVIGVLTRPGGNVALVIGPDGYGTTLRIGDKLYDGEVRRIDPITGLVVFRQRLNDPTRIKPFRDIEKGLNLKMEGRS
jgi:hypothetical protein